VRRLIVFLLGGIAGAGLDQIHVQSGVLSYPRSGRLSQPWWVAPQFGAAFVAVFDTAQPVAARAGHPQRIAPDAGWFVGAYLATGVLRRWPRPLGALLYLSWAMRMAHRAERRWVIAYAAALALAGSAYEHALSGTSAFGYADPEIGNIPSWLPALYLHGAPLALDLAAGLPPKN
jgi:hypothetical protein